MIDTTGSLLSRQVRRKIERQKKQKRYTHGQAGVSKRLVRAGSPTGSSEISDTCKK